MKNCEMGENRHFSVEISWGCVLAHVLVHIFETWRKFDICCVSTWVRAEKNWVGVWGVLSVCLLLEVTEKIGKALM